jgi:hypothetical protein
MSGVTGGFAYSDYSAILYWAVITNGAPASDLAQVQLPVNFPSKLSFDQLTPDLIYTPIQGTVIGTSSTPCWSGDRITVYRGLVPTWYLQQLNNPQIRILIADHGNTALGGDPWVSSPLPEWEGAAAVFLMTASGGRTAIFESPVATVAGGSYSYTLTLPAAASTSGATKLWRIAADGQLGSSISLDTGIDNKTTTLNGVLLGGPSSSYSNIGMFLGHVAWPLPQLMDVVGVNAGGLGVFSSTTGALTINDNYGNDCVTHMASVLEIH